MGPFLWVADAGTGVAKPETGTSASVGQASIEGEALDRISSEQMVAYVETEIPKKFTRSEPL